MFQLAIIGLGPAGIFTLAHVPENLLPETLILEKSSIGGDLSSHYSGVIANITKMEFIRIFKTVPKWANESFPEFDGYQDNDAPKLADTCKILRRLARPDIRKAHLHTAALMHLLQGDGCWKLVTAKEQYEAKRVILCLGATPKTMDLPLPTIPLHVALSESELAHSVSPNDTIVVFGTAHSGTLILKSLKNLGCKNVCAVYRGAKPFNFAADTVGGLKLAGAAVAQEITDGAWGDATPKLISYDDFASIYRVLDKASSVIYAIGFDPRTFTYTNTSGACTPITNDTPGIYGFGIGRPRIQKTPTGESYTDIGFEAFIKAIQAELPVILA